MTRHTVTSLTPARSGLVALAVVGALTVTTAPGIAAGAVGDARRGHPTPGAPGIGDRLFPTLGNGGYDAKHYDLRLRYATAKPSQGIDGTMTMRARAKKSLSRFNLDFGGKSVKSVWVDGRRADVLRDGQDLEITPVRPVRAHHHFTVQVRHFRADPTVPDSSQLLSTAFFITPDGSATSGQPSFMHTVFPSNDHPRDKASFTFHFDVPKGQTAVANGDLVRKQTHGDRSHWTYRQRQPMATELTQLVVGKFTVIHRKPVGRVEVRDVVPTKMVSDYRDKLGVVRSQLKWMEKKVGRYPFDLYGSLVVDTSLGFALETQTLSLYDKPWFTKYPRGVWDPVMLHELTHQWFGDNVAPYEWSDVWLNEGHASWYEFTYADAKGFLQDDAGAPNLDALMKNVYAAGDQLRHDHGPVARPLSGDVYDVFNPNVYEGGALVLYALRQKIGKAAFSDVERAWVRRWGGKSAGTDDFIRLASRVSGKDLRGFLRSWLYGTKTPAMPGHPGWKVDPVGSSSAKRSVARSIQRAEARRLR